MGNEDFAVCLIIVCLILHNLSLDHSDAGEEHLSTVSEEIAVNTTHTSKGKQVRDALLMYARRNHPR